MSFLQAIVIGIIQGIFELFPLSSLGHTVLIPSWIGGSWAQLVHQESQSESPYLAFIVGLHLANAVALLLFYAREWGRIIAAFFRTLVRRRISTDTERLAWLIVIATIPVGAIGLVFEHTFRTLFAKPLGAAVFLCVNGLILLAGERFLRRGASAAEDGETESDGMVRIGPADESRLARLGTGNALVIGAAQCLALLAGISREGVVMVGGMFRGLSRENALRFAFLLSTPVIFAAGVLKVPDLTGSLGNGIRGQVVAGSVAAVLASLVAIYLAQRWFRTRSLAPFAAYSLLFGAASVIRFGLF
ncbi:MAG: undecaprenyl-diphosphate phosphatase [Acidimicrobiales bacterium]